MELLMSWVLMDESHFTEYTLKCVCVKVGRRAGLEEGPPHRL